MGGDQDNKHEQPLQAVLLADSFLSTFRPITLDKTTPKVLCPLNNVTMLDYSIEFLAGAGVEELYVFCVTGGEAVEEYVTKSTWTSSIRVKCVKDTSVTNAGDALRELDKLNVIQSDPFILMSGDVVTNVDIVPALEEHKLRHKKDSSAIMTCLLKKVGGWSCSDDDGSHHTSSLRSTNDDLIVALNGIPTKINATAARILHYNSNPAQTVTELPASFFSSNAQIELRNDMLDTGIYICSPDVLARFSDEFDFFEISKFISNSVAEEEEGLQSKIYASILKSNEYAARIHDPRTYHAVSRDLLKRWCYPMVPDNLPSGYDKVYRYEMRRHMMYVEQRRKAKIGRGAVLKGPGMVGSQSVVQNECTISRTTINDKCTIGKNVTIKDSHLWQGATVEDNVTISESILCNDCIIKKGATVPKGCIIGRGCVIGANVILPEFTRVTLCNDEEDDDGFSDFDGDGDGSSDDDSAFSSSSGSGSSSGDESSVHVATPTFAVNNSASDHAVVGNDGLGRVWTPNLDEFGALEEADDSDYDSDDEKETMKRAIELVKSQSIGFDPTSIFQKRMQRQLEDDDEMSDYDEYGGYDDGFGTDFDTMHSNNLNEDGFLITGRQAGVDVVKEMKSICMDHDVTSPIENLRIELNSFKFSQNATFGDCVTGAILAIFDRLNLTADISASKLVSSFKSELKHWGELLEKLCHTTEEEKSVIIATETAATGGGIVGDVLSRQPSFRFIIQTLHEEELISEEAILSWSSLRREGNPESAQGKLFQQGPTQQFLEWIEEDSESSSDNDDDSSGNDDDSDED